MLCFKRKRYTNLTAQSFIVLALTYLTIVISDTFAGRSWRRNATNYWRKKKSKEKDKSGTVRLRCLCSPPVVVVHRHVVYLCHGVAMFTYAQLDRAQAPFAHRRVLSPLFLICASNHAAPHTRATRASMLYWQISILKSTEQWRLFSVFNGHCAGRGQQLSVFCPPPSRASHIFAPVFARVLHRILTSIHNIQQWSKWMRRKYVNLPDRRICELPT